MIDMKIYLLLVVKDRMYYIRIMEILHLKMLQKNLDFLRIE